MRLHTTALLTALTALALTAATLFWPEPSDREPATAPLPSPSPSREAIAASTPPGAVTAVPTPDAAAEDQQILISGGDPGTVPAPTATAPNPALPTEEEWFTEWEQVADDFAIAFVDHSGTEDQWRTTVTALMTGTLASAYSTVDEDLTPTGTYQGATLLSESSNPNLIWVDLHYDTFTHTIGMLHTPEHGWQISSLEPR